MKQQIKSIIKSALNLLSISISKNQKYDRQSIQVMQKVLHKKSNCIDIGCHKGEVLKYMLRFAPEGKHYGFEPIPHLYKQLVRDFNSKCQIFPIALSDTKGEVSFNYVESNPAYSGFKKRKYDRETEDVSVISVTTDLLDAVIYSDIKIDFIKVDVEGAELQVFKGAVAIIKRCKPILIFEHGLGAADVYGTKPEDIFLLLSEECKLKISLMEYWLKGGKVFTKKEFVEQFEKGLNYYFIAFP